MAEQIHEEIVNIKETQKELKKEVDSLVLENLKHFRVEKFSHDSKTFPPIVKCAVFDELDVSNHIYIFCTCALPKRLPHG